MKTLDDTDRTLTDNMLVIADPEKACCIAGIMGGLDSEVTKETTSVILECASFKGSNIRHTGACLACARKRRAALNEARFGQLHQFHQPLRSASPGNGCL